MGGSSSSKSTSTQETTQIDRRIGAADQSQVAVEGGSITTNIDVESIDPEVVQTALVEAFGFGGRSVDKALAFGTEALDLTEENFAAFAAKSSEDLKGLKALLTTTAIVAAGAFFFIGRHR